MGKTKKSEGKKGGKKSRKEAGTAKGSAAKSKVESSATEVTIRTVKKAAEKAMANPVITEVVAATLVAAAAALKDPKKARALAAEAGNELEQASESAATKTGAFWQLALDVARRSVEALAEENAAKKKATKPKKAASKGD